MITLKQFMETINYRITEGGDYGWNCYGSNGYSLDSWNGDHDGHSFTIIFDTKTQEVYEVQAHDYSNNRAYRLINPEYVKKHRKESKQRGCNKDCAWDDVDYTVLETDEDWLEKATAIAAGEDYDTRISVPLELEDDVLLALMKEAHKNDLTFNEYVEDVLAKVLADDDFIEGMKRKLKETNDVA